MSAKGLEVKSVLNNDFERIEKVAQSSDTCLAFANSDSGENYLVVDGNEGDRNNLTLWHEGDKVIQTVADACENTIVVLHTVGQVDMEAWIEHPNVKAVIWAGLPGESNT